MMAYRLPGLGELRRSVESKEMGKAMEDYVDEIRKSDKDEVIIENSTEGARDPLDGALFVKRLPHEVRPAAHTGVNYQIIEDCLELGLENPPHEPEYHIDSVRQETPHRLCQACLDVLNYYCQYQEARHQMPDDERIEKMSNSVIHHHNLVHLIAWAKIEDCHLCKTLRNQLERRYSEALELGNLTKYRTEVCWKVSGKSKDGKPKLYFVITMPSLPRGHWNFCHYFRAQLWDDKYTESFQVPSRSEDEPAFAIATNTGSPTSAWLALSWVYKCRQNDDGKHDQCNAASDPTHLPTRLLNVELAKKEGRLILLSTGSHPETFITPARFITLSHCWGKMNLPVLTTSNLEQRQTDGLRIDEVPQSFRDAIEVASWFNVKWLWIDCLCILQDSHEDWLREASMMSANYKQALLNISADRAGDARGGCFTERDAVDIATIRINAPKLSSSWWIVPDARYQFDWMDDSHSFSRAWIHRERQLSRRILHFTERELIFECCSAEGYRSETFPGGMPFKRLFNRENKFQVGGFDNNPVSMKHEYDPSAQAWWETWNQLCEIISTKRLTVVTDMPIVLSSLAEEFAATKTSPARYLGGLWESMLPDCLLWNTNECKKDGLDYIAPSWSWMAASCAVTMSHYTPPSRTTFMLADVGDIETELLYPQQPYGPLKAGSLTIRGIIRRIAIDISENLRDFDLSVFDTDDLDHVQDCLGTTSTNEPLRLIGNSWDEYKGDTCIFRPDGAVRSRRTECYIMFVKYEQWKHSNAASERQLHCLILEAVEDGSFRRIGTMTLHDLFALKIRYRVVPHKPIEQHESKYMKRLDWEKKPDFETMLNRIQRINDMLIAKREKVESEQAEVEDAGSEQANAVETREDGIENDEEEDDSENKDTQLTDSKKADVTDARDDGTSGDQKQDGSQGEGDESSTHEDDDKSTWEGEKGRSVNQPDQGDENENDETDADLSDSASEGQSDDIEDDLIDPLDVYAFDVSYVMFPGYEELTPRSITII